MPAKRTTKGKRDTALTVLSAEDKEARDLAKMAEGIKIEGCLDEDEKQYLLRQVRKIYGSFPRGTRRVDVQFWQQGNFTLAAVRIESRSNARAKTCAWFGISKRNPNLIETVNVHVGDIESDNGKF